MSKIPVLVLGFNRPDHVEKAILAISQYKPERIYLACDGAHPNKANEKDSVDETRRIMVNSIDWDCEVKTKFQERNLGCAQAVYDAITWFFENEEWGIICEDDVILSLDFFLLCEDLLPRYKDCEQVMHINAEYHKKGCHSTNKYNFGKYMYCWGWASWRRAWDKMDMSMAGWPNYSRNKLRYEYGFFKGIMFSYYFSKAYKKISSKQTFSSWATRWAFSIIDNNGYCINPLVQLSTNIGLNEGEHYAKEDKNPYANLTNGHLTFPLIHPTEITLDPKQVSVENRDFIKVRLLGLSKKIMKILNIFVNGKKT